MKKTIKILALPITLLTLVSCHNASPLYESGAFMHSKFEENYVLLDEVKDKEGVALQSVELATGGYSNGRLEQNWSIEGNTLIGAREMFPEAFVYDNNGVKTNYPIISPDLNDWNPMMSLSQLQDFEAHPEKFWGRAKCLATIDDSFKTKGVISKAYNGQMACDGLGQRAFIQMYKQGIKTLFPKKTKEADVFLLSIRGGTDGNGTDGIAHIDINVNLYYKNAEVYDFKTVTLKDVTLKVDQGGDGLSFVGFSIKSALGEEASKNIAGFGLSFANLDYQSTQGSFSDEADITKDFHFGYIMNETMLLDSTWTQ